MRTSGKRCTRRRRPRKRKSSRASSRHRSRSCNGAADPREHFVPASASAPAPSAPYHGVCRRAARLPSVPRGGPGQPLVHRAAAAIGRAAGRAPGLAAQPRPRAPVRRILQAPVPACVRVGRRCGRCQRPLPCFAVPAHQRSGSRIVAAKQMRTVAGCRVSANLPAVRSAA